MSAAWPRVVNRLVALLPTLPGWSQVTVYDGEQVGEDVPTDYVTVGFVLGEDFGGQYAQTRGLADMLDEDGTVRSDLVCWTGDDDLSTTRARAFALVDAWEAAISADQTLGVLPPSSTSVLSVDVAPSKTGDGTEQRLVVTLTYFSRS